MQNFKTSFDPKAGTKQTQRSIDRTDEVRNNAGGMVFGVTPMERLRRFLLIGSEGGTYYVGEKALTLDNVKALIPLIKSNGVEVVNEIVRVSDEGLAPRNDPALYALALATVYGDEATKQAAYAALPKVARIATHLFHFVAFRETLGGWGKGMRKAVSNWYNSMSVDKLAYQVAKYGSRDGWSHRDVLRLAHPIANSHERNQVFAYIAEKDHGSVPEILEVADIARRTTDKKELIRLINQFSLTREMVNKELSGDPDVQMALLNGMPITAVIRNLGNFSKSGLLKPMSEAEATVLTYLRDGEKLRKGRIHPISLLMALKTYQSGSGFRGAGSWDVNQRVVDALNDAFYSSFGFIVPSGKKVYVGLDISGSMSSPIMNSNLSCAEAAAAMAMAVAKVEPTYVVKGFAGGDGGYWGRNTLMKDLHISPSMRLDSILERTRNQNFGTTDCALPMLDAIKQNIDVDVFVIYTDNETWAGNVKPYEVLRQYRQKSGRNAKLIVCGMTSSGFTIADPNDSGMMDVVGFSSEVPQVISNFVN